MKIYDNIFVMTDKPVIPYTESIVFAAEYLARACREYARKIIKDNNFKLSFEEYLILETVSHNPGLIQMDVAKRIFMQRSYMCKLLSKLEDDGFVKREKTIKGKRQQVMRVYATELGTKVYQEMQSTFRAQVLNKSLIEYDKMREVTAELFDMANSLVDTYNLKL